MKKSPKIQRMQQSIFLKYFSVCATLIFSGIIILGAVFMVFASQYFKEDKYRLLRLNVEKAADLIVQHYDNRLELNDNVFDREIVMGFFDAMAQNVDATFFVTNNNGNVVFNTNTNDFDYKNRVVEKSVLSKVDETFNEFGKLGGFYEDNYLTVATPIKLHTGEKIGYIFTSSHAVSQQKSFLSELLKMFFISSVCVLVVTFIAAYFVSAQMIRPLRQMSMAAQKFGKGDFNARIHVTRNDEIGQLGESLNNMAKSLSSLESMRRSFTANISHELKTPMTSISGFIDGILDGTIPPEKQKFYLTIVSDEIKRLSRLVKTMLNLSRIEAGEMKINVDKINIVDSICQTVFSFEQQIEKKHINIRGLDHEKIMVEADPDLIHQVIYNLTENAVKFVEPNGYIEFNLDVKGDKTYISVKNSGTGLSKEELPKIFERFYKTDKSRGLDKNGVGLGLYIVRSIIDLHGGEITVNSVENEYVEFVFCLKTAKQNNLFKKN